MTPQDIARLKARAAPPASKLALDQTELKSYNLRNVLLYLTDRKAYTKACGLELEVSARATRLGLIAEREGDQGVFIPWEVMARDLVVGTPTAGGNLVAAEVQRDRLIDLLRPVSAVIAAGADVLPSLVGSVAIPRMTAGATISWVGENTPPTEASPAFDQVTMSPHTALSYVDIGRRLMLQTGGTVSRFIASDLRTAAALAIDYAAINGSGASNQPRGILSSSGVGLVVGGTNGAAPTYDHAIELEALVANQNSSLEGPAFITNSRVRAKLEKTQMFGGANGVPIWRADAQGDYLKGRRAFVSNNVPNTLTKGSAAGVCSALLYGNWPDLLIGMWGEGVTVMQDAFTMSTTGGLRLVVYVDCDIALRYSTSFSTMVDALTT